MSDTGTEFDEIAQRIRVLTTILEKLRWRAGPESDSAQDVPKYLERLVTLLTCGDDMSTSAATVVAATGSLHPGRLPQILIVNPYPKSPTSQLRVEQLPKGEKSFQDVVAGNPDAPTLQEHITDIRAALAGYDSSTSAAGDDYASLTVFVVSRCFRKIQSRYNEDKHMFRDNQRLVDNLDAWTGCKPDKIGIQWVTIPRWLRLMFENGPDIEKREVDTGPEVELQWKLSRKTLKGWASVLSHTLRRLNEAIERAANARGEGLLTRPSTEEEHSAIVEVYKWCYRLYLLIRLKGGKGRYVIQTLLEDKTLQDWIEFETAWRERDDNDSDYSEDSDDSDSTPASTRGTIKTVRDSVPQYLRTLTAWHSALEHLCFKPVLQQAAANLQVGLVEVSPLDSNVCAQDKFVETYLKCYHWRNEPYTQALETIKEHYPQAFTGTIHAEAALLGLLAFVKRGENVNYGGNIQNPRLLHDLLQEAEDAIVVAQKCCWCCAKLAQLVEDRLGLRIKIPGTNGLVYAWSPPTVGIHVEVLQKLEQELWCQFRRAISRPRRNFAPSPDQLSYTPGRAMLEKY